MKGIKKRCVKKNVRHGDFVAVLRQQQKNTTATFRHFRTTNHVLQTVEMTKLCLDAFDDKRYILQNGVNTLAYGHYATGK